MRQLAHLMASKFTNPMSVLTMGLAMSVVMLPIIGSIVWSMYDSVTKMGTRDLSLQRLVGQVAHLNELLTMYARLASATGDPEWESRYRTVEPQLDNSILGIATAAREEYERNYAAQTKLAYTRLIEMEAVALALVRKGRPTEASGLLFSREYENQKALYSQGISKMTGAVENRIAAELESFRKRIWFTGFLAIASLVILLGAWLGVSLVIKRHLALRKKAEADLAEEKERLAVTLRSIGDGVITTDILGRVNLVNRMAEVLTGWRQQEAVGRQLCEVMATIDQKTRKPVPDLIATVLNTGAIGGPPQGAIVISRDGPERIIAYNGAPIRDRQSNVVGAVLVFRDITEQQHMLNEVLKAEKLESVGILAGGIAHDFNNILTAVAGNISLARMTAGNQDKVLKRLSDAEKAVSRARDLTQQLLTFSRGGAPVKKTTSIKELLSDWAGFALRGSNVKCVFRIPDDLWHAEIDQGQISQVFHNLIINADQAMPDGGRIYVSGENYVEKGENSSALDRGHYVKISVRDEGVGVAPDHLQRIFDPYFTTKETGSGLGLATSYSTIKRHGGHIAVQSKVGLGTTFDVFLPASESRVATIPLVSDMPKKGRGKILLMDDESMIRDLGSEMLRRLGYQVFTTRDGLEAITVYKKSKDCGEPFDAVIMDLTIPGGMGGKEALKELLDVDPGIKAIVSSGYSNDPIMGDFKKFGFAGVLSKPYSVKEMSDVLHTVVNALPEPERLYDISA